MIYLLLAIFVIGTAFHTAGLMAIVILPMTVAALSLLVGLIGLMAGVEQSGSIVLWSIVVLVGGWIIVEITTRIDTGGQ